MRVVDGSGLLHFVDDELVAFIEKQNAKLLRTRPALHCSGTPLAFTWAAQFATSACMNFCR
jgi:hypothetical protein